MRELCVECDRETGRAGKGEDSLYALDFGPYCEDCWDDVPNDLAEIIEKHRRDAKFRNQYIALNVATALRKLGWPVPVTIVERALSTKETSDG